MTGYLLDTSTALLALASPEQIPAGVRRKIEHASVYLSVISYWEVLLKSMKGKLVVGDPRAWWPDALEKLTARPLPLRGEHISRIYTLAPIHQDPFDRALIAQATVEHLTFVTIDGAIRQAKESGG